MDFFKIGLRNILGISIPGVIVVFIFLYSLLVLSTFFNVNIDTAFFKDATVLITVVIFIFSYLFGSIFRLSSADAIDEKSRKHKIMSNSKAIQELIDNYYDDKDELTVENENKFQGRKLANNDFKTINHELHNINNDLKILCETNSSHWHSKCESLDKVLYFIDIFPYPILEYYKFETKHPDGFFPFYNKYRKQILNDSKNFFNLCKTSIYASDFSSLKEEVDNAEAFSRFLAGTYFALKYSIIILIITSTIQIASVFIKDFSQIFQVNNIFNIALPILLILIFNACLKLIIKRFRNIRLKEVDTVFDAFYLINNKAKLGQ